jgi:predicted aspartyl protease
MTNRYSWYMGITHIDVKVAKPGHREPAENLTFLVDSGALVSVVPTGILDRLGIGADATQTFILANGQRIERRKGIAMFIYGERVGGADVVFGEDGDALLLGVTALEALGLGLDPFKRELISLPMLLARELAHA